MELEHLSPPERQDVIGTQDVFFLMIDADGDPFAERADVLRPMPAASIPQQQIQSRIAEPLARREEIQFSPFTDGRRQQDRRITARQRKRDFDTDAAVRKSACRVDSRVDDLARRSEPSIPERVPQRSRPPIAEL